MPLPVEIVHSILDEVWNGSRTSHAASESEKAFWKATICCSSVSWSFRAYILPKILSRVECHTEKRLHGLHAILVETPTWVPLIKTFQLYQDLRLLNDPSVSLVLSLLTPSLQEFVIELRGVPQRWTSFDKGAQEAIQTIIGSGNLKVVRLSGISRLPVALLQALHRNVKHVQMRLFEASTYKRGPLAGEVVNPRCQILDIELSNLSALQYFGSPSLVHLTIRHREPLFIHSMAISYLKDTLQSCPTLRRLSIVHDTTKPLAISGCHVALRNAGVSIPKTPLRHVEIFLPLHFILGQHSTKVPFPGPIHEVFRDDEHTQPSLLETVVIKITLTTLMMLSWTRSAPTVVPQALDASDWSQLERELCSTLAYPRLKSCTIDLSDFSNNGIDMQERGEVILRPKFRNLISQGIAFRVVL